MMDVWRRRAAESDAAVRRQVAKEPLPSASAAAVDERGQHEQHSVARPIRLWLSETQFFPGRAVDISLHGLRLFVQSLPVGIVQAGDAYHLEICPETSDEWSGVAVVRHVNGHELDLETREEFPAGLIGSRSAPSARTPDSGRSR
jgi:hypothetical protein